MTAAKARRETTVLTCLFADFLAVLRGKQVNQHAEPTRRLVVLDHRLPTTPGLPSDPSSPDLASSVTAGRAPAERNSLVGA